MFGKRQIFHFWFTGILSLVMPITSVGSNPSFKPVQNYALNGLYTTSVAVGDVNGDGKLDVIAAQALGGELDQGLIVILLGNGDGTFHFSNQINSGGGFPQAIAVADLNADGKLDLIVANCGSTSRPGSCPNGESNGILVVFLGNGDASFQNPQTYDSGGSQLLSVVVAD